MKVHSVMTRPANRVPGFRAATLVAAAVVLVAGCATAGPGATPSDPPASEPAPGVSPSPAPQTVAPPGGTIRLYSTVTQATVDAIVEGYQAVNPNVTIDLFRAPTGEVAARIAAELREGGVRADLFWLTDPLSIQQYDQDGLLAAYAPPEAASLDPADQGATFWATRHLNMVMVGAADLSPAVTDWGDLTDPALKDAVALPDPGFAGSAFGLLGAFAQDPAYGLEFYQRLKDNGAIIVKSPDEVTTGVAEGRFKAGITLDFSVRSAIAKGSPVRLIWPTSGAVTMYSPIAMLQASDNAAAAKSFIDFVLSGDGQAIIAASGWEPARADVAGGPPIDGSQVRPDWTAAFREQADLLAGYRAIFGE